MKLADVKERIDKFFRETSSEELYRLSLACGFEQVEEDNLKVQEEANFKNKSVTHYKYVVLEKKSHNNNYEDDNDYLATA